MAGLLPQLRPFVRQLWAALFAKGYDDKFIFTAQVLTALTRLKTLLRNQPDMHARVYLAPPKTKVIIVTDASPTGGGAVLFVVPAAFRVSADALLTLAPWTWMARRWDAYGMNIA